MKINSLYLKNIGPFLDDNIDFIGNGLNPSITIITGENGTGKTIVLDAIRRMLTFCNEERNICREEDFKVEIDLTYNNQNLKLTSTEKNNNVLHSKKGKEYFGEFYQVFSSNTPVGNIWITNYWTSKSDNNNFDIGTLQFLKPEQYLYNSLNGIQKNIEVIQLITYFDYLKSSDSPKEKIEGEFLFETLKKIIKLSLIDGEFKYVERKTLMPIVSQNGFEVSLDKLSSGNLYLIQRMISLLGQMYSVYTLNNLELKNMLLTPGLLMIDEAENHLHPKWQKTFLKSILSIFPNLQLIVTTHSPFIVSSVENARVYVCKSMKNHSILLDETDLYSNKPIDEVLASDVFETSPFSETITELMNKREIAINENNISESEKIEEQLKIINPQYFSYFDIDKLLNLVSK
jgi:predicted ATP-binding protein involved in virulence